MTNITARYIHTECEGSFNAAGSLWTQSPVELTPALKQQLDAIGPVRHIVSPNYEHTKFGRQWKDAYPEATLYGCPGLPTKAPDKQCVATSCSDSQLVFS